MCKIIFGGADGIRTHYLLNANQALTIKLLNKMPVSQIAELSKLSKAYISQVKNGRRPPSQLLVKALEDYLESIKTKTDYVKLFLLSRQTMGCTAKTLEFYSWILSRYQNLEYTKISGRVIEKFLNNIPESKNNLSTRHAYYRTLKVFHNWLNHEFGISNPMTNMSAPILSKTILPVLTAEQVKKLIDIADCNRDKAIISLFTESGLRLSELASIKINNINWENMTIRVFGKGKKEAYAPFGQESKRYLQEWLKQHNDNTNIWGVTKWGIVLMLRKLQRTADLPCNPHTFRRTFACLLRKQGIDTMTIKDLGRWESLEMVQRYTRSVTFQDSLKFYKSPLC